MKRKQVKLLLIFLIFGAVLGVLAALIISNDTAQAPAVTNTMSQKEPADLQAVFDKKQYSLDDPDSQWVVVNKKRPLPKGYAPNDLASPNVKLRLNPGLEQMQARKQIEPALIAMFAAAKNEGVDLVFGSGYRSEKLQSTFYSQYVAASGQAEADKFSARPRHSEHQTGFALDVSTSNGACHLEICFADTPEGKWVALHAHEHGFVVRYPEGKESVTGYQFEPWHIRYVGTDLASELYKNKATLEEFFELGSSAQY